tara:strand:- start:12755 stop:13237 length:483 start_codon:yes stop_codon:yes gene_type:complete
MLLTLKRFSYSPTETEGILYLPGDVKFATIEQPWVPNPNGAPGGKPFESCVPDGMYKLIPWTRPNGDDVYLMHSVANGVYMLPSDHKEGEGRNLCLIHKANWAHEIQGCIAPGVSRLPMPVSGVMKQAVGGSGAAMSKLREILGREKSHLLDVVNATGTK